MLPTEQANESASNDNENTNQQSRALAKSLLSWIEQASETPAYKRYLKNIVSHRRYVRGYQQGDENEDRVRTNIIYSTLAGSLPLIYARNPEISITPNEAVDETVYPVIKQFCRTLEITLQRQLDDANLKKRGKACTRSAQTTSIGWVKVSYQRDQQTDVLIQNRIQDTQDNLQRLRYLSDKQTDSTNPERDTQLAEQAELEQQLNALENQVEVTVAEGLVIDRILSEDIVIDTDVVDFDCYEQASKIAHRIWLTADRYEQTFSKKPSQQSSKYGAAYSERKEQGSEQDKNRPAYYAVWELWDRISNTVYTLCEGDDDFAREPYQPDKLGEQWYPFFPLAFNLIDGQFLPISDVELLSKLQDEYEDTRNDYADVRKKNKPHYIASSDIKEKDIIKKIQVENAEVIVVDSNGRPLRDMFTQAEPIRIDPAQYDVSQIRADAEYVYGMGDAAHGNVSKAKTATEAEILQGAMSSRTGERQDTIEDWIQDIANYSAEILLQELSIQQVQRIAGQGAVWPEMSKDSIYDLVNIEIRAGSSGKPNKQREQQQWIEFLPQLQKLVESVAAARQQGNEQFAQALINIAKESLRRFDERIDVEEFLPQAFVNPQDQANDELNNRLQEQENKQQQELSDAQVAKLKSETFKNTVTAILPAIQNNQP